MSLTWAKISVGMGEIKGVIGGRPALTLTTVLLLDVGTEAIP